MKEIFESIWKKIEIKYNAGEICSERHLQALTYHYLIETLAPDNKVFIEPKIFLKKSNSPINRKAPDLIITNGQFIQAIIEIKYIPHGYVSFESDVQKLLNFNQMENWEKIPLFTEPHSGQWNFENNFSLQLDHWLIYMVIANRESDIFNLQHSQNENLKKFLNLKNRILCFGKISQDSITFKTFTNEQNTLSKMRI